MRFHLAWLDKFNLLVRGALVVAALSLGMASVVVAAPPDYGKGFEILFELGLKDATGWQYVALEGENQPFSEGEEHARLTELLARGWLGPKAGSGNWQPLLVEGWQVQGTSKDQNAWPEMRDAGVPWSRFQPLPKAADQAADVKELAKLLGAAAADESQKETLLSQSNRLITMLFFAAHAHKSGHREEAAAIAEALFKMAPLKERLLDAAVGCLASMRFHEALIDLGGKGEWKALDEELTRQLAAYTRGWPERPMAEQLQRLVKQQLARPVPPDMPGGKLTPEQQAWWREMATPVPAPKDATEEANAPPDAEQLALMWLGAKMQPESEELKQWQEHLQSGPSWLRALLEKDWDWPSVVAAGLEDETLVITAVDAHINNLSMGYVDLSSEFEELSPDELEEKSQYLPLPRTRGDFARKFITAILPRSDEEASDGPPDLVTLGKEAEAIIKKLAGKDALDIARLYFWDGSSQQKSIAFPALIGGGTAEDQKKVEEAILAEPSVHFNKMAAVLQKRGPAGKAFLEKYNKALLEEFKTQRGNAEEELPDHYKSQLAALESLVSGKGVEGVIEDFVARRIDRAALWRQVSTLHRSNSNDTTLMDSLLAGISRLPAEEGTRRWEMLRITPHVGEGLTEARKELLRKILAESGTAPVEEESQPTRPFSSYVYWTANSMADPEAFRALMETLQGLDADELWPLWDARGKAVLDGLPIPPSPSADAVPEARRAELTAAINQHLDKGWPEYVAALTLSEKLALRKSLEEAEELPAWQQLARKIIRVNVSPPALKTEKAFSECLGKPLTGEVLAQLAEACRKNLKASGHDGLQCLVKPLGMYQGMSVLVFPVTASKEDGVNNMTSLFHRWFDRDDDAAEIPFTAIGWTRWQESDREIGVSLWEQKSDGLWAAWEQDSHDILGRPPAHGTFFQAEKLTEALNRRLDSWKPGTSALWLDAGATLRKVKQ